MKLLKHQNKQNKRKGYLYHFLFFVFHMYLKKHTLNSLSNFFYHLTLFVTYIMGVSKLGGVNESSRVEFDVVRICLFIFKIVRVRLCLLKILKCCSYSCSFKLNELFCEH